MIAPVALFLALLAYGCASEPLRKPDHRPAPPGPTMLRHDGLAYEEIGARLGVTAACVRVHHFRALASLRKSLA